MKYSKKRAAGSRTPAVPLQSGLADPARATYTVAEVSRLFGYAQSTIYDNVRSGRIPAIQLNNGKQRSAIRIPKAWVEKQLGGHC